MILIKTMPKDGGTGGEEVLLNKNRISALLHGIERIGSGRDPRNMKDDILKDKA